VATLQVTCTRQLWQKLTPTIVAKIAGLPRAIVAKFSALVVGNGRVWLPRAIVSPGRRQLSSSALVVGNGQGRSWPRAIVVSPGRWEWSGMVATGDRRHGRSRRQSSALVEVFHFLHFLPDDFHFE
jgi:hypothetical protein